MAAQDAYALAVEVVVPVFLRFDAYALVVETTIRSAPVASTSAFFYADDLSMLAAPVASLNGFFYADDLTKLAAPSAALSASFYADDYTVLTDPATLYRWDDVNLVWVRAPAWFVWNPTLGAWQQVV